LEACMDSIQKFYSDAEKIKKHERQQGGDSSKVVSQIKNLFIRNFRGMESLATSFADYWDEAYIRNSQTPAEEPTKENLDRLVAMMSVLEGSTEFTDCLVDSDWKRLCSLTNIEAEDLPIETLNDLMMIFVDKKAL